MSAAVFFKLNLFSPPPITACSFIQQTFWGFMPASPVLGTVGNRQIETPQGAGLEPSFSPSGVQLQQTGSVSPWVWWAGGRMLPREFTELLS